MSTNYSAAIDTSDIKVAFVDETVWGTAPTAAFQQVRLTGESLSENKQRNRPQEIKPDGVVSHAITTQVGVEGALNFALSAGTFDKFIQGALNSTWGTAVAISSAAIDVTAPSTFTGFDFAAAGIVAGQWVRVGGFTTNPLVNNGYFKVVSVNATDMVVTATNLVTETSSGTITVDGSRLINGTTFNSHFIEKQLASALFLKYAGAYVSQMQLSASVGNFVEGSFNVMAKSELKGTTTSSTGAYTAPTTGRVIDTVAGVAQILGNGTALSAPAQSLQLNLQKQNARAQYAIGSADAQGMGRGTIDLNGTLSLYFKDFTMYDLYKAETDVAISFRLTDNAGDGYMFTLPAATLMNPSIVAGGPDSDVMAEFQLEGNPDANGVILQIDRFA
jgi:Phage tail tube protein